MNTEQLEQITNGFTFLFEEEEVYVSSVKNSLSQENAEVTLCKSDDYTILGDYKKSFIAKYLQVTKQDNLLDINVISAGKNIVKELGLVKIPFGLYKNYYKISSKHWSCGGIKPKSIIELGRIAMDSVSKKELHVWLNQLKNN